MTNMVAMVPTGFHYDAIDPALADNLRQQGDRIRARLRKHVADILETGRDLLAVKDKLEHGLFTKWAEIELKMTMRTAQRFMAVARLADEVKNDTVSLLPPATVYRLAAKSTPPEIRNSILERVAGGDIPSEDEVADLIKADIQAQAIAQREAKRKEETAAQRRRRQRLAKERAETEERRRQEREREEEAKTRIAALIAKMMLAISPELASELHREISALYEYSCLVFWIREVFCGGLEKRARDAAGRAERKAAP